MTHHSHHLRLLWTLAIVGALVQVGGTGAVQWWLHTTVSGLPSKQDLSKLGDMAEATVIFDASERPAFSIFEEQRREVRLGEISPHLVSAMIAIEDQRFYDHAGVDLVRIAGAALANLRQGRRAQGGSTITQQLARQSFLTPDKTFRRKVQEVLLAMRIEREYSKAEILELYLNKVYFGSGLYGAEAAALGYFGKPARDLTLDEAALLAGLVKSPSSLSPAVNMDRAVARRNVVLQAMHESGQIDADALARARDARVQLVDALRKDAAFGKHFRELVRIQLVERFGRERVYGGGLKVYTTIDLDMQRAADAAVTASLDELDKRRAAALKARRRAPGDADPPIEAALVAIDPLSGEVRAMVGGRRFADSTFNRAVQARRQPGSAFKPLVYAAALENGYSPASLIQHLNEPIEVPEGAWTPEDGHADEADEITMRSALRTSSNRAAVRMIEEVGVASAVDYARRLGVGEMPAVPSLALGSGEVTLLDLTSAYGAFAAAGVRHTPLLIRRVEDAEGTVLFKADPQSTPAVSPGTAFLMSTMLADVINNGTAWKARQLGFTLPAAGKTGTTNEYRDAWFVGYTPSLVSGVWVGYDQPQPILPGSAYAGDVAVPMWARFMKAATINDKPVWFRPPGNIVTAQICRLSGRRPGDGCGVAMVAQKDGSVAERSTIVTEYFARGTESNETCHLHVGRSIFARIGGFFTGNPGPAPAPSPSRPSYEPATSEPAVAAAERTVTPAAVEPEPKKKRGFWSRLFGRRDRAEDDKAQDNGKKKPRDQRER